MKSVTCTSWKDVKSDIVNELLTLLWAIDTVRDYVKAECGQQITYEGSYFELKVDNVVFTVSSRGLSTTADGFYFISLHSLKAEDHWNCELKQAERLLKALKKIDSILVLEAWENMGRNKSEEEEDFKEI